MKSCLHCKYAEWLRTDAGKLHQSGRGKCTFDWQMPPLPACRYFYTIPVLAGGFINRNEEMKDHCVYFARATK